MNNLLHMIQRNDPIAREAATDWLREIIAQRDHNRWIAGDVLNAMERAYGRNDIASVADEAGCRPNTLYSWMDCARAYDDDARQRIDDMANVSWSHCAAAGKCKQLATQDDRLAWLEEVSDAGWSVRVADAELRRRYGSGGGRGKRIGEFTAVVRDGMLILDGDFDLDDFTECVVVVYANEHEDENLIRIENVA